MAHIIFEFNNNKYRLEKSDSDVEKIFESITGIKIERKKIYETKKQTEDIAKEINLVEETRELKHPSIEELINLFKTQINFEFGTELVRKKFYPNLSKEEWKKAYYSLYSKIENAMKKIEEQERGHFIKRKEGRFTYYTFVKDNIPSLSKYETKTNEEI
ncbi:MAG: hypothetical protein FIB07_13675 [Candidatus Methanoperedens sp.]|nr:hypothetical protein [Candidatus Methanoperedens sp.]